MIPPVLDARQVHHAGGEYAYEAPLLTLSWALGRTRVEMLYDGISWNGTSSVGDIKVMPAGQRRIFRHREGCNFTSIKIDESRLFGGERADFVRRPHAVLRDGPLRAVLGALWAEQTLGPVTSLFQSAVARAVVFRLQELDSIRISAPTQRLSPLTLERVIDYLHAHLARDVTIDELAAMAGLSAAHFSTLFRNSTGEPPHRYHNRLRVERARALLQQGMTPPQAAVTVGFYDHSHLARHMRRVLGTSPAKYRPR